MPREKTANEVRTEFIDYCHARMEYWLSLPGITTRERVNGAVFSVLVALDGEAVTLPGFFVVPDPHEDDQRYHADRGENWYPPFDLEDPCDIGGGLHEAFVAPRGARAC
jgi:hypothetical protein